MSLTRGGSGATRSITRTAAARMRSTSSVASRCRSSSARSTAAATRLVAAPLMGNGLTVFGADRLTTNVEHLAGPLRAFGLDMLEQHPGQVDFVRLGWPVGQSQCDAAQQDVDQRKLIGQPQRAVHLNSPQRN